MVTGENIPNTHEWYLPLTLSLPLLLYKQDYTIKSCSIRDYTITLHLPLNVIHFLENLISLQKSHEVLIVCSFSRHLWMKFEPHGLGENDPTSGNIHEYLRAVKMEVGWHTGERESRRALKR